MTTGLPAKSDTIMISKDIHLEQITAVVGTDLDMLRSLNPEFRRDIIPGNTKPYAVRMPIADIGKYIDLEDSVYNYNRQELFTKRAIVDVNDDLPTYSKKRSRYGRKSSRYARNRGGRYKRGKGVSSKRKTASSKRKATSKKKGKSKKKSRKKR
jgi:membrane-bound lytic murein transglycosylase D